MPVEWNACVMCVFISVSSGLCRLFWWLMFPLKTGWTILNPQGLIVPNYIG